MPRKTKRTSDALERRFTIRTSDDDFAAWEARARELGYVGAAPWVRRVANEAIAAAKQQAESPKEPRS